MAEVALACHDVWKRFRMYHQRSHTLKEKVLSRRNVYEEFWALKGIDLEVARGTTMGIIGGNGSGKSTLLKTLARILVPDRGHVEVNGTLSSLLELGTGFHPELTGRENIYLGGSLLGQSKKAVDSRYDEIVEFAGIGPFIDLPIKNYSSGMYARLAFAVAISIDPDILLIDEVLSVGDEGFQMRCFERISQFRAQGSTIVLVSHSLDTIRSLCSDAVWIQDGLPRATGEAHDVVARYLEEVHGESTHDSGAAGFAGRRYGSGEAEITGVAFLGPDGTEAGSFRTGDPMTIRVSYRAPEPVEDAACGVALYRAETLAHVFGQNTTDARVPLALATEGTIEFNVPELPLLKGTYVVTVALHDRAVKKVYDWHERRYSFMVFENSRFAPEAGMVRFDARWSASSPSRVAI